MFSSCCICGALAPANALNTCLKCIQSSIDITEGIPKKTQVYHCSKCERYLQPPSSWLEAEHESPKLLSICLKRLPGLSKVKLVDANFVWTEPHSKHIQIKLVVQKQILEKEVLEQTFRVDFLVINQICTDCQRFEAKDYWKACVQIRQKSIDHKRTILYLEQVILKNGVSSLATDIKPSGSDGVDFFFQSEPAARKFFQFVQNRVPCRCTQSKQLISHDIHSNLFNYKYIFSVEVVPICKDSVICLPPSLMAKYGNSIGPICVCFRVSKVIHLIDPNTMKRGDYFRYPFLPFCGVRQLKQYIVSDIEHEKDRVEAGNMKLANVWLMRCEGSDNSVDADDNVFDSNLVHCRTHLGAWLKSGCYVAGYDIRNMNFNDDNLARIDASRLPDVVLVKRVYPNRRKVRQRRKWRLKRLDGISANSVEDKDFDDFMDDIEEDKELRQDIAVYRANDGGGNDMSLDGNESCPEIEIDEMLNDLHIQD